MAIIKTDACERKDLYKLLIATVIPRPIAWITTLNKDASINLAPYSAYNMVCSNPTTISFAAGWKAPDTRKDTLSNILRTKEFVINTPRPEHIQSVALSAAPFAAGESEADAANLPLVDSSLVAVPRLQDAVFALECELQQTVQIGEKAPGSATLVLGTVKAFHIQDDLLENGKVDFEKVSVLSRLGGYSYASLGKVLEEKVPKI